MPNNGEPVDTGTGDVVPDSNGPSTAAVDTSEVEQAAYEARLGRLMMLRAARAKRSADT